MADTATSVRSVRWLIASFALVSLIHLPSFFHKHLEGDEEIVYQALAHEMNWDFSHYTTMAHPRVREFPSDAYRLPLYFHPPLLPYVLKIGGALGAPLATGLLFQLAAMLLLVYSLWRAASRHGLSDSSLGALLLLISTCPVLASSTTKLHIDGLMAAFLTSGLLLFHEALERRSLKLTMVATLLLALALNAKFNCLVALPLLGFVQLVHLWRVRSSGGDSGRSGLMRWEHWREFAVLVALLVPLGGWHYLRLLHTYGTLFPFSLRPSERTRQFSLYTRVVHERTRPQMFIYLLILIPASLALLVPRLWKGLGAGGNEKHFVILVATSFAFLFLVTFWQDNLFRQERYYSAFLPLMYLSLILLIDRLPDLSRNLYRSWIFLSCGLMLCTVHLNVILCDRVLLAYKSTTIAPAMLDYFPFLDFLRL